MNVGIVGAGAAGCICAYNLLKLGTEVTLFDNGAPLRTLLFTGGGRCNLAHAEYDFKALASNYPRGEKFLYSVFSRFSTYDTISLFEELGVETYVQDDGRIFPKSNSAKDVHDKILSSINKAEFIKERVNDIIPLEEGFKLKTNKAEYFFSHVIISSGGKGKPFESLKHNIIKGVPSLVGLNCDSEKLSGIILKNICSKDCKILGDLLFTHFGISGPLIYKISSLKARDKFPYKLSFDTVLEEFNLQECLNSNPHKDFKNVLSEKYPFYPQRFAEFITGDFADTKASKIDGKTRDYILDKMHNFTIEITGTNKGEETVTAGGYDLDEINPKTMESKIHKHLYVIGEALNIDGFCGGFNLQNAWSTAYVAANGVKIQ